MITREMIKNGFENNLISIEDEYNGCISLCCRIGDEAFYFIGMEDSNLSTDEYWKSYTLDETVDMIYEVLKSPEEAELNGLDDWEIGYYESVLNKEIEIEEDLSR